MIKFTDNTVIKTFPPHMNKQFNMECYCYQQLQLYNITPKLLSITNNSIVIERYDTSIDKLTGDHDQDHELKRYIYGRVVEIAKIMDSQRILHGDLAPRNIVIKYQSTTPIVGVIDFSSANISDVSNLNGEFYRVFSDLLG